MSNSNHHTQPIKKLYSFCCLLWSWPSWVTWHPTLSRIFQIFSPILRNIFQHHCSGYPFQFREFFIVFRETYLDPTGQETHLQFREAYQNPISNFVDFSLSHFANPILTRCSRRRNSNFAKNFLLFRETSSNTTRQRTNFYFAKNLLLFRETYPNTTRQRTKFLFAKNLLPFRETYPNTTGQRTNFRFANIFLVYFRRLPVFVP